MPRTIAVVVAVVALGVAASGAVAQPSAVTVVHRGQMVRLAVAPGGTLACLASINYADKATQNSGIKHAVLGKVAWTLRIPSNAAVGLAHWSVRCGPTWHREGTWRVVAASTRPATPALPVVQVTGSGFSQRPDKFGTGSKVSFGLFLKNTSAARDAENIYVLVNFVDAGGQLLGTMSKQLQLVAAGQTFGYGDEMSLRTQTLVSKLEVTIRVGDGAPAVPHPLPHYANVRIIPDSHDPNWVSEIDGEVANDTSKTTMTSAQLSLVVLDASGAIVGGGTSNVSSALPSGSREVFLATRGFSSFPTGKAASVDISALPQYQTG